MTSEASFRIPPGTRALVTGGASGIGLAIADALVDHGAAVHICGTDETKLEKAVAGGDRTATRCDVADRGDVDRLFVDVRRELGGLDVLVNNAGIAGPTAAVEDVDPDDWLRTMDVNVNGVFLCTRRAVPLLKDGGGAIVNISSVAGRLGYAFRSPYCASKFALQGITESLAKELGPFGIRVNSVLPGFVDSDRLNRTTAARADALGIDFAEMEGQLLRKTSLRTKVTEEEVAAMVVYLCSAAGARISGQSLSLCGNVEYL